MALPGAFKRPHGKIAKADNSVFKKNNEEAIDDFCIE